MQESLMMGGGRRPKEVVACGVTLLFDEKTMLLKKWV
jgi:hypothetical protein